MRDIFGNAQKQKRADRALTALACHALKNECAWCLLDRNRPGQPAAIYEQFHAREVKERFIVVERLPLVVQELAEAHNEFHNEARHHRRRVKPRTRLGKLCSAAAVDAS